MEKQIKQTKQATKRLETVKNRYFTDMQKNKYYQDKDLKQAWELACKFYNREYMPILLKSGNHKLSKNILIWDIPSIVTCKGACNGCYALKAERIYKNTRIMRAFHYAITLMALDDTSKKGYLKAVIISEINRHVVLYSNPILRLHSSGDLFNNFYIGFWLEIAHECSNINIYTYSKQLNNKQIDDINGMFNNFNIIKSMPCINKKHYINFGGHEYIKKLYDDLKKDGQKAYICSYGTKNEVQCGVNCTACLHCSNVLFYKH